MNHLSVRCQHPENGIASEQVNQHEKHSNPHAPDKDVADGHLHGRNVPTADKLPHQGFGRIGKAIGKEREQQQEFHENGADGQDQVAVPGRYHGESHIDGHHAERPDEQVSVHRKKRPQIRTRYRLPDAALPGWHSAGNQDPGKGQAGELGDDRSPGNAGKADPAAQDNAGDNVYHIDNQVGSHGTDGVLHPNKPALDGHQGKGGRRSPDADEEVAQGQFAHGIGTVGDIQGQVNKGPLEHQNQCGNQQGQDHPAEQDYPRSLPVFPSIGLGRKASRPHTQETEVPVQQVEQHGSHRDPANQGRRFAR